jgi:hypothetical protein
MKKFAFVLCVLFVALCAFFPLTQHKSGIYGTIDPPEGAKRVWAINGKDSVSTTPLLGKFSMEVKPGTWKLIIEATAPLKNAVVENILVQEGQSADAGLIKLTE